MSGIKWGSESKRNPVTGLSGGRLRTRLQAGTDFDALERALAAMEAEDGDQVQDPEPQSSVADVS